MLENKEFYEIIKPIIEHPEFIKRKKYKHHENESVFEHCLEVSYKSYKVAKALHMNARAAAIGGILHDFYYEDWQENKTKKKFFQQHGFVHAREALDNSHKHFPQLIDKRTANIIKRHMFPLTIKPPVYKEGWIVTMVDKGTSLRIFKHPRELPKYLGIRKK